MREFCITGVLFFYFLLPVGAQTGFSLGNQSFIREFSVTAGQFRTTGQRFLRTGKDYHRGADCPEFAFRANGRWLTSHAFSYVAHTVEHPDSGVQLLKVSLVGRSKMGSGGLHVEVRYWLYDTLALVRKQLIVTNRTSADIALTDLDVEHIPLDVSGVSWSEIYSNFGTSLKRMPYRGDYDDAAILLYHADRREGVIIGNEALSVMKRTEVYTAGFPQIRVGLAAPDDTYPFKKYLAPGEAFSSPRTFLCFAEAPVWQDAFEGDFAAFIRQYMGIRLFQHDDPPLLIYNTWRPYRMDISDEIVRASADGLAGTGTDLFIVDCGWYDQMGSYVPDPEKFPDGLEPVFEYIRGKGMKTGLWFSFASVNENSSVAREHPEWLLRDSVGNPMLVHDIHRSILGERCYTMSLASPWYDYIRGKIAHYVRTCKLDYIKLDLAVAIGSYQPDPAISGDYDAGGEKGYRDRSSSYWELFEKSLRLCDDLRAEFPDLLIDYTYETHGRHNGVDYALLQHAEYDWITNYELAAPAGPLSIRQLRSERARTMPVSTLLIGNQLMEETSPGLTAFTYLSLASATGILVGDVRHLPDSTRRWYSDWHAWFREMDQKYQYTRYYQTSDVFDHPSRRNWDGCYRFNPEKGGGVLFFYRNDSPDSIRTFPVPCVVPTARYRIVDPMNKRDEWIMEGKQLIEGGVRVSLPSRWSARVLGIEQIHPVK